jgi:hypothetical protein
VNSGKNTPRLLGAAYLVVLFLTVSTFWTLFIFGVSDDFVPVPISDGLANVSNSLMQWRISILLGLILSAGIVVLAVLLFVVLHKQNKTIALVALGLYLAEAILLAVSKIGNFALIPLSLEYVKAGAPDSSYFQILGTLFFGVDRWGDTIHMLFFCLGGILWYYLLYRSKYVPRVLSVWGLLAVSLALIGTLLIIFDFEPSIILVIPNGLFELTIGLWLMLKGIRLYKIES